MIKLYLALRPSKLSVFFLSLFLVCAAGIVLSILHWACLRPSDGATLFAGLLAAAIVWWQGYLIKGQMELQARQMELQAIIDLHKEWNSTEMIENRRRAWNDRNQADKFRIEDVLEFLEKVSTFERRGAISAELVWDTFGWYVWRYYHYSAEVIGDLRKEWTPKKPDPTLYQDLEVLYDKLLKQEIGRRGLTERDAKEELDMTREKFITSERRLSRD
jgi:hypothetical protein